LPRTRQSLPYSKLFLPSIGLRMVQIPGETHAIAVPTLLGAKEGEYVMAKRLCEQRPAIPFNRKNRANAAPSVGAAAIVTPARWAHFHHASGR
jgi:hypothetical protein